MAANFMQGKFKNVLFFIEFNFYTPLIFKINDNLLYSAKIFYFLYSYK